MDLEVTAAVLGIIATALAIAEIARRWFIAPLVRAVLEQRDAVNRIEAKVDYHLEPNGEEEGQERRPVRSLALDAKKDIGAIKDRQANDYRWHNDHEKLHARHGIE